MSVKTTCAPISRGFSPLLALFMWLNLATDAFDQVGPVGIVVKVLHGLVLWGYLLGFVINFSTKTFRHGRGFIDHQHMTDIESDPSPLYTTVTPPPAPPSPPPLYAGFLQ